MKTERQSNIELLRIISMIMVLAVHIDGASLGLPHISGNTELLDARSTWKLAVESATIIGVNCFTMISGYFGIRLRLGNCMSFLFQCIFYSFGIKTIYFAIFPDKFSITGWIDSMMVLTHTDLWYIPAYFGLMIISPVLNTGLDALSKKKFGIILFMFGVFNIWCGWVWNGSFNPTGYTIIQLILIYMIGRYIKLFNFHASGHKHATIKQAVIYVTSVIIVFTSSLLLPANKAFAYNSPFVIMATTSFFLIFRNLNIKSQTVNYIAQSAFAVYLLHKDPVIWINAIKPSVQWLWNHSSIEMFSLYATAMIAAIYLVAMAIDSVRRLMFNTLANAIEYVSHRRSHHGT